MRWKNGETWESLRASKKKWHRWFAWHPVTIYLYEEPDGKVRKITAWLEYVWRSGTFELVGYVDCAWVYEYRAIEANVIND